MATFLFNDIIFGPVRSRRLGLSLGVNLLPIDKKYCNFDCIYCECGWTCNSRVDQGDLPSRKLVAEMLAQKIGSMREISEPPDVITFAGNGEPTLHPEFEGIIEDTIGIRDRLSPEADVAVLSNAAKLERFRIRKALGRVDQNILKLDTTIEETFRTINRPQDNRSVQQIIGQLVSFEYNMILQTLFFRGTFKGIPVDNTTEKELVGLFEAYRKINPERVMVYTFDRDTPTGTLEKIPPYELRAIAGMIGQLGIPSEVYG